MTFNIVGKLNRKWRAQGIIAPSVLYITESDYNKLNDKAHSFIAYPVRQFRTAKIVVSNVTESYFE